MYACQTLLVLGLLTAFAAGTDADDKDTQKPKRLTAADCEKLVEQLVNPEKPPFEPRGEGYVLRLPRGMAEHEKTFKKIGAAYNTLSENIEVALPVLMKHINDKRYSFVGEQPSSGVYQLKPVGWACSEIVHAHVEAHLLKTFCHSREGHPLAYSFIRHCGGLDKWWGTRKGKLLAELQLEAMEWVMKQERPKLEVTFESEEAWKEALKGVAKMADEIRKTRKPIKVERRFYTYGK